MMPELIEKLRDKLSDASLPEDELELLNDDAMLWRYLKARNGDLEETEKMLRKSIEWRRMYAPHTIDCKWCHERPGMHSLRQIGFDEAGRPVLYSSFTQAATTQNTAVEAIAHLCYVLENAVRSMPTGIGQWILIFDCSGMNKSACHPRLAYDCAQILANHYPERLYKAICVQPGLAFLAAWKAIKAFLPSNTLSKLKIINSPSKMQTYFETIFCDETSNWLLTEIAANKRKSITPQQRAFWMPPDSPDQHDPRGSPDYVRNWLLDNTTGHRPHPNIVDQLENKLIKVESIAVSLNENELNGTNGSSEDEITVNPDDENDEEASNFLKHLPDEFQIPENAIKLP